jgi:hypothetical protein
MTRNAAAVERDCYAMTARLTASRALELNALRFRETIHEDVALLHHRCLFGGTAAFSPCSVVPFADADRNQTLFIAEKLCFQVNQPRH